MTWNWTSQFELYPTGSDQGATTAPSAEQKKRALKERLETEHVFDDDDPPVMSHIPGECTVVEIPDEVGSLGHDGGLQYGDGELYRDNGISIDAIGTANHQSLADRDAHDHPQYYLLSGDEYKGDLIFDWVINLPTSYGGSETSEYVLSRGQHLSDHASGGADHDDDILDFSLLTDVTNMFSFGDLAATEDSDKVYVDHGDIITFRKTDLCSMPYAHESDNHSDNAFFIVASNTTYYGDYNPNIRIQFNFDQDPNSGDGITLAYTRFS